MAFAASGTAKFMIDGARFSITERIESTSERSMLLGQLEVIGLGDAFTEVLGLDNIYAHSKTEIGIAWRCAHPEDELLMVGDTLHDAEVAAAIRADCVLLSGGHQRRARLSEAGVPIVDNFAELVEWIDENRGRR